MDEELNGFGSLDETPIDQDPEGGPPSADGKQGGEEVDLDFILDIQLQVIVEMGRTKMPVNDLLSLQQGSVIELDKMAGEPMEIRVNNKLLARGEAVVVDEKFGVRLTEIISPRERIESLKKD